MKKIVGVFVLAPVALLLSACSESVEQAPSCTRYVECVEELDEEEGVQTDLERFVPGGNCWNSDVGAELCATACERGLLLIQERREDAPEACR